MSAQHDKKPADILADIQYDVPAEDWQETKVSFDEDSKRWCYSGAKDSIEYLEEPNPRDWQPRDDDWKLPDNWQEIILEGIRERMDKFRSFRLFMDICVRCGACADKCHFYLGTGDPKNMPVLRAELLRSVYRKHHTLGGKLFGKMAGARDLTEDVLREWFYYFYQCTQCRRCSVFCPYGIDTAEVTFLGRELLQSVGLNIDWAITPIANSFRTGNHLGIQPHTFVDNVEFAADDLSDIVGKTIEAPINRKGAEVLVIVPSADYFGDPHYFTFLGYMALFEAIGLDYTFTPFAGEGGNFGSFVSHDLMKRLNSKIYDEAKRLKVKWILGGECGHMWRVLHQYMDTMNGPADFLETPKSPMTGTVFENAAATKMVHICEFTADLIRNNAVKLDPSRNSHWNATYHDSCNPARGMGMFDEPREVLRAVLPEGHFHDMPENCIREQTFCCGSGAGLGTDENLDARLRGGLPRANAVKHVKGKHGVNVLSCVCAIDKATLPGLVDYWVEDVGVAGIHEFVGNAVIIDGETRETDMRQEEEYDNEPTGDAAKEG